MTHPLGFDHEINQHYIDVFSFGFVMDYAGNQETTIAFDGTNTFTLAPVGTVWHYYRNGVKYEITGSKTLTLSGTPPATKGIYYIYIDSTDGSLSSSTTSWTLEDTKVPVASIMWDNSLTPKYWMADERHTCAISRRFHWEHHLSDGTEVITNPTLTGPVVTGGTPVASDNTCAISQAVIADEDIKHILSNLTNPNSTDAKYVVMYRTGVSTWSWVLSSRPFLPGTNRIQYDNAGTMTDATDNYYVNYYLLLTNMSGAARFIFIPGQAQYQTIPLAQAESFLSLSRTGLPINEFVAVYQFTWKCHLYGGAAEHGRLEVTPKSISASGGSSSVSVTSQWGNITGTLANQTDLQAELDGKLNDTGDTISGQLVSSLATGTSPFSVASTTLNTNLNADQLDGLHGSGYVKTSARMGNALTYLPFDGNGPYNSDYTGSLVSQLGQTPDTATGGILFRPGKFGKAFQAAEATTNLITNPSFEVDATSWILWQCTAAASTNRAYYGTKSLRLVATATAMHPFIKCSATAGQAYTLSGYVYTEKITPANSTAFGVIDWYNASDVYISSTSGTSVAVSTGMGWVKIFVSGTAPANTSYGYVYIHLANISVGDIAYLDGMQFENKAYPTPYCDGSLGVGHSWAGTANASSSSRTATSLRYTISNNGMDPTKGTIRAWVYHNGLPDPSNGVAFCLTDGTRQFYAQNSAVSSRFQFMFWNGASYYGVGSSDVISAGWHQIVMTWSGTALSSYCDGVYVATYSSYASIVPTSYLYVGTWGTFTYHTNNLIDDIGILDSAWSSAQVLADYESGMPLMGDTGNNLLAGVPFTQGTSFPINPVTNHKHFRTDLGLLCYYDGTRWLTVNEYQANFPLFSASATASGGSVAIRGDLQFYATRAIAQLNCTGTQDASNYWSVFFRSINAGYGAATTLYAFNTIGIAVNVYVDKSTSSFSTYTDATNKYFLDWTVFKTNSPGNISAIILSIYFRYIVT